MKYLKLIFLLSILGICPFCPLCRGQGSATANLSITVNSNSGAPFLLGGQGWTQMANTKLQVSQGVNVTPAICPPNNFNSSGYNFSDGCHNVYDAWSGGAIDQSRERLLITGGGHGDYSGNELYSLNFGQATPTLTRITNPVTPIGVNSLGYLPDNATCPQGTTSPTCGPPSVHTYGGLMVDPLNDVLVQSGGSVAPSGSGVESMWWLTLGSCSALGDPCNYTRKDSCGNGASGQSCTDPNAPQPSNSGGYDQLYFSYDRLTMTYYVLTPNGCHFYRHDPSKSINIRWSILDSGNCSLSGNLSVALDPVHRQLIIVGDGTRNGDATGAKVFSYTLESPYNLTDRTSQVGSSCANALSTTGSPGIAFDERTQQFVGIPASLGNTVWVITAPASGNWSCTPETYSNGPPAPNAGNQGVWGRFQYSVAEDAFILAGDPFQNAFYLHRSGVPTAQFSDFQIRSTAPGVLRAHGFDNPSEFTDVSGGGGFLDGVYPPDAGGVFPQRDTTNFVSGAGGSNNGALKLVIQDGHTQIATANSSGLYRLTFGPDANPVGVGAGGDIYFQFRLFLDPHMINYFWPNVGGQGWKVFIMFGPIPGASCTGMQFVQENTNQHDFFSGYTSCGTPSLVTNGGVTPYNFEQGDYNCTYPGALTDPPCFIYPTNTWVTVYWHVHVNSTTQSSCGPVSSPCTSANFEAWATHGPGLPLKKFISLNNFTFDSGALSTDKFMQIILQDYLSGATGSCSPSSNVDPSISNTCPNPASFMEFDEAIVSRQPIASPRF